MKIIKLSSENLKRVVAVEITPDGNLITVGGKNDAGKSSVLDSIAYALGGTSLVPSEPIRKGESEARVVVDLGDLIVTRKFKREEIVDESKGLTPPYHVGWGPTSSTLTVTNKEGARYPSPQAVLDKLLGKLSFDPLAFSRELPKKQDEILRKLVNLDFTLVDGQSKTLAEQRAMQKKTLQIAEVRLGQLPVHPNLGLVETPISEVSAAIKRGHELRELAQEAQKAVVECESSRTSLHNLAHSATVRVEELKRLLHLEEQSLTVYHESIVVSAKQYDALVEQAKTASDAVPNFEELDAKLREVDSHNTKVRQNIAYAAQETEVKKLTALVTELNTKIAQLAQQKADALASAQFPVPGLGLGDEGPTFDGIDLKEVSRSKQLRVSVAIGLALNPTLKVLLVRDGNFLDSDGVRLVAKMAEEADAQVWMEYVTESAEGVSVMMEDGHVA